MYSISHISTIFSPDTGYEIYEMELWKEQFHDNKRISIKQKIVSVFVEEQKTVFFFFLKLTINCVYMLPS